MYATLKRLHVDGAGQRLLIQANATYSFFATPLAFFQDRPPQALSVEHLLRHLCRRTCHLRESEQRGYDEDCLSKPAAQVLLVQCRDRSSMKNILSSLPTNASTCSPERLRNVAGNSMSVKPQPLDLRQGSTVEVVLSRRTSVVALGLQVYAENTSVQASGPRLSHPNQAL